MTAFVTKHSTGILMSGLVILLILAWAFPSAGLKLGITFLLMSFFILSLVILEKHQKAYREGQIPRGVFIRNVVLEISGGLIIMILAGLMGKNVAQIATQQIGNDLIRIIAGIVVGLVIGLGVGITAKKLLRRLVEITPKVQP